MAIPLGTRLIFGLAGLLALAGCAGASATWSKPGAGDADFQRDAQLCQVQAAGAAPPVFDARTMSTADNSQDVLRQRDSCLFAHGWQLAPRP
ncbi:MAG TPA: hypothetical protein VFC38_06145 [Stellaceae bacterium]|nr:hypothetical protein [Stellaceae bacterium]